MPSYSRSVSSGSLAIILGLFDPEHGGTTLLQNIANCLHKDTALHSWTLKSSTAPLYKPQIFQTKIYLTVLLLAKRWIRQPILPHFLTSLVFDCLTNIGYQFECGMLSICGLSTLVYHRPGIYLQFAEVRWHYYCRKFYSVSFLLLAYVGLPKQIGPRAHKVVFTVGFSDIISAFACLKSLPLTLILLTWRIGWAHNNASKQRIGRRDVFVTMHPWYNCINNQLGATITVY